MPRAALVLVGVGLALPLLGAPPAAAQTCTFSGVSGSLSPAVPSILNDQSNGNLQDTESGTFNAAGTTNCGTQSGSFSASGSYVNTVCGSGTWDGNWSGSPFSFSFHIQFVNGHGQIFNSQGGPPIGYMQITPVSGNCVNQDVSQWAMSGAFAQAGPPPIDPNEILPDDPIIPPGTREASKDCDTTPTVDVIDTGVAGGWVRLKVKQVTGATWVCFRLAAPNGAHVGGRLTVTYPAAGGGGTPSVDASSGLCATTPGNQAPGPHPIAGPGSVGGQTVMLDTWQSAAGETWVCADLGSTKTRVKIATPGVTPGSVTFESDA